MRILLLDGQVNPAVTAVRSLARAGHRVVVGSTGRWSKAGWSRYASGSFTYPGAEESADGFAARIATEAKQEPGTFVLPVTEKSVMALSAHRSVVEEAGARVVMPSHAVMLKAYDKAHTTRIACELGVAAPHTSLISDERSASRTAATFSYPAALKSTTSVTLNNGSVKPTSRTVYARDPQEFQRAYHQLRQRCTHVIAQEFISGVGLVYCALLCRGELRAEFAYRRLRSVHPTGWGAALRVSVPAKGLRESSLRIMRTLDPQWTGLVSVEYRLRDDGTPFFLEVNPRTWNSLALAVYAGVDFPRMLAKIAEDGDVAAHNGYRDGVFCRWWLGDLRRLIYIWQGIQNGYPGRIQGRFPALLEFLKPVPRTFHDNFIAADPLPEVGDWLAASGRFLLSLRSKNGS